VQSYWERETLRHFDLIVVGGGIVGHSTALFYAESHPNARIAILERGLFPEGASTKNAGFACFGSIAELEHDLASLGADMTVELVLKRFSGLQLLRQTLGDQAIDYHEVGGYELCFEAPDLERINFFNGLLEPALGARPYSVIKSDGFGFSDRVHSMIKNALEGTIDTGKMMGALQRKVAHLGVQTFTQSAVAKIEDGPQGKSVCIETASGTVELLTQQVALCTNAFSKDFFGRGLSTTTTAIIISEPWTADCFWAVGANSISRAKPPLRRASMITSRPNYSKTSKASLPLAFLLKSICAGPAPWLLARIKILSFNASMTVPWPVFGSGVWVWL
jgi:gamma-glutamylputrescine oxidase